MGSSMVAGILPVVLAGNFYLMANAIDMA